MSDTRDVASLVDATVSSMPGVDQTYVAAPTVHQVVSLVAPHKVHAHVVTFPTQQVRVSIGVSHRCDSHRVARDVAHAVRAVLPDDWSSARVQVQIRRIHEREPGHVTHVEQ